MTPAVRILAVADSDSNLKWAAAVLERLGSGSERFSSSIVIVRTQLAPSPSQTESALSGTSLTAPPVLGPAALRARIRQEDPDVLLVAAVGPISDFVARLAMRATDRRPVLLAGLPGIALTGITRAAQWRSWADAFVVHSRREVADFSQAFAAVETNPAVVLMRLPFLPESPLEPAPVRRVVFAPQSKAPASRDDRIALLDGLARLAAEGFEVVVKLRASAGERQTHNERYPYDALWLAEHSRLGHPGDRLVFGEGPMSAWLAPDTALVTVSSTAAIESLALGLPAVFVSDFGLSEELLNGSFADSGCMLLVADIAEELRTGGPVPAAEWLERNGLHRDPSTLPEVLDALAARRRSGELERPQSIRIRGLGSALRTMLRVRLPLWVHRRLHATRSRRPSS